MKLKDKDGNYIEVLAMLDSGSNTSFISKNVAKKLGIRGYKTHLTMNLAGGQKKSEESELVDLAVYSTLEQGVQKSMQAYAINKPCSSARTVSRTTLESYPHLKPVINNLHLSGGTVDLLIGTDFADAFNDMHVISEKSGEPIAKRNCFGWYVIGTFAGQVNQQPTRISSVDVGTVSVLEDMKKLLTQDLMGVTPTELCTCRDTDLQENKFIKSISESTKIIDGRVQVRMPWREDGPPNESNYDAAYKRMISSEKSFKKKDCTEIIDSEVQKLVELDFITEIPPSKVNHNQPEWYLPLQVVFTPERTTQVRLVFDASAKGPNGKFLNDYLEKGPNYINSLLNVLMAWRYDNVAYTGDVRKMFNQVLIHPEDQVFHRFLWRPNENEMPKVYQWKRLNFGDKPAPDIAAGAINTLAKASQDRFPEAAEELRKHVYVDDIGGSKENEERSKRITNEIDSILATGCFQVKEWNSNNQNIDQSDQTVVDFLGHKWNKAKDTFSFKKNEIATSESAITKRNCLAYLAQLWDPIGLVTPTTIELRIDLQELWGTGYSWDQILPDVIQSRWKINVQVLNQLLKYEFSRKLKPDGAVELPEIHGFCDAGEKAYGSVLFLRWKLANGTYTCTPILVKAFVSPLKKKSTPRLELMGCLSLARVYKTCEEALQFAGISNCKRMFWIDSQIVLSWLKTCPRKFKPFVSVRVAEIQETIDPGEFHFIKSSHNPADALTKGITPDALEDWLKGPKFLRKPEEEWPAFKESSPNNEEKRSSETKRVHVTATDSFDEFVQDPANQTRAPENPIMEHLMKSCSTFRKARKTMAYVLRFISNTRTKEKNREVISPKELSEAELWLFKWSQQTLDKDKLDKKLIPSEDEQGLLRAHGRLENIRSLPNELRNPIILPKGHRLVHLLLVHLHEKRVHCGSKSLIYESRRRFWIIGVRHMAKHLTAKCVICKKLRRKPLEQLMGQLPKLRVAVGFPAFSNTAIDMFGPLQIRVGRKTLKEADAIIFTCMTTRAVHLELVTDRSTDTFLMAFRRFTSLRGNPNNCWSDCGTNFIGAQHYLKEITQEWDIPKMQSAVCEEFSCTFHWNWNVPRASHQNGVVESLIKSVRRALEVSSKTQVLTEEQWRTFLAQVTCLVNQRPLYPSSNGIWEGPPVTPNDLLIGNHFPPPVPEEQSKVNPRNLVRSTEKRVQEFWHCWLKYFAPDLLPRNKWYRRRENLREGDLVLEMEPTPRRTWKMAVVLETFPGDDGLVMKAKIKTANAVYDRPIHKLCLIATKEE